MNYLNFIAEVHVNNKLAEEAAMLSLEEVIPGFRTEQGALDRLHDYAVDLVAEHGGTWSLYRFVGSFEHRGAPVARIERVDAVTALGRAV